MKHMQKTILLVEDNGIVAMSTRHLLESHGYAVLHAFNGEKALARIREVSGAVHLILMDIDLGPGMDGTETARAILRDHDIPVVFVSSHTETEIVRRTGQISSHGYVVKDAGEVALLASIQMALR